MAHNRRRASFLHTRASMARVFPSDARPQFLNAKSISGFPSLARVFPSDACPLFLNEKSILRWCAYLLQTRSNMISNGALNPA